MSKNRGGTESLKRKINALNILKDQLPTILANDMVNFFKKSFRKQGWDDGNFQKWQARKGEITGGIAQVSKKSAGGRAVLVKTGDLVNSLEIESANWKRIRIKSDLPYSAIHNEGKQGLAWGKHSFKMPKRKFMGNSRTLTNQLKEKMEKKMNIVFRK